MGKKLMLGFVVTVLGVLIVSTALMARKEKRALTIEQVRARHEDELLSIGVYLVGIGECEGKPCIQVSVAPEDDSAELREKIPSSLGGYKVVVKVEHRPQAQELRKEQ